MLKKFFLLFASCIAFVLILGLIFSNFTSFSHHVEYWIVLLIPTFAVPILTAVLIYKEPIAL